jgi:hypothetical protein
MHSIRQTIVHQSRPRASWSFSACRRIVPRYWRYVCAVEIRGVASAQKHICRYIRLVLLLVGRETGKRVVSAGLSVPCKIAAKYRVLEWINHQAVQDVVSPLPPPVVKLLG